MGTPRKKRLRCAGCRRELRTWSRSGYCLRCRPNHVCKICGEVSRTRLVGGWCETHRALSARICAFLSNGAANPCPDDEQEWRLTLYAQRAAATRPLFDPDPCPFDLLPAVAASPGAAATRYVPKNGKGSASLKKQLGHSGATYAEIKARRLGF